MLCVKFKSRSLFIFFLLVSFWLHKFSFVNMQTTAGHVEEGPVLYEILSCITLKIFVTQSELELQGMHNRAGAVF